MIIWGRRWRSKIAAGVPVIHRLVTSYPRRYVVTYKEIGWNPCERCGIEHKIWLTSDRTWRRLPRSWRSKRICTRCFRDLTSHVRRG